MHQEPSPAVPPLRQPIRLLVLDDNTQVGGALARWFSLSTDFEWGGALQDPSALDDFLVRLTPHVVLIDWHIPGVNTSALIARAVPQYPSTTFAVLSAHVDAGAVRSALRAGAKGYLSKSASPADLATAVRMLALGKGVLSPEAEAALKDPPPSAA